MWLTPKHCYIQKEIMVPPMKQAHVANKALFTIVVFYLVKCLSGSRLRSRATGGAGNFVEVKLSLASRCPLVSSNVDRLGAQQWFQRCYGVMDIVAAVDGRRQVCDARRPVPNQFY